MECTTIAIGSKGSIDGSTLISYNADCSECDWRVNKVPPKDHEKGAQRPVYLLSGSYPLHVRSDHGETWTPDNLEQSKFTEQWKQMGGTILGWIPQVEHTFGYVEGLYGIMNENQVAIGESTCASRIWAAPVGYPSGNSGTGKALLEVSELSQIAMERATTAREAIKIMGDLATQYGFYSADWDSNSKDFPNNVKGEGGEALSVADPNEAWIFHIVPDDTGASAVWVAQRIPDDHVAVVANQFVIREVIKDDPNFMYSNNLFSVAEKLNYWHPSKGPLNFLKTYGITRLHPEYSNLRVWRVFTLLAPDSSLPSSSNIWADEYPFSIKLEKKISELDLMNITRDHYEGTEYDTSQGIAGGPFGDPNRFDVAATSDMTKQKAQSGSFPRTISMFRTSYSFVGKPRAYVPNVLSLIYFTQYSPDISTFTPIYVHSEKISSPFMRGSMHNYSKSSFWWNSCVIGNYISRFYNYAIRPIRELQVRLETDFYLKTSLTETIVIELLNEKKNAVNKDIDNDIIKLLTDFTVESGNTVNDEYKNLFPILLAKYRDGYEIDVDKVAVGITPKFYPKFWLETVGYFDSRQNKNGILFAPSPQSTRQLGSLLYSVLLIVVLLISFVFTYKRWNKRKDKYQAIVDNTNAEMGLAKTESKLEMKKLYVNI